MVYSLAIVGNGVNKDYNSFVTTVMARSKFFIISELGALAIAQEKMIEQFQKYDIGLIKANLAQTTL